MATVVVFAIGFSHAFFTAESTNPKSSFAAADLKIDLSKAGQLLDGTNLKPGATRNGTVAVTNVEHKAKLTLGASGFENTPPGKTLAAVIQVTVKETSPTAVTIYSGSLDKLKAAPLGTFANGEQRSYSIDILWPADQTDLALAGVRTSFGFDWSAQSVP
jgi:hypothetical protein